MTDTETVISYAIYRYREGESPHEVARYHSFDIELAKYDRDEMAKRNLYGKYALVKITQTLELVE